MPIVSVVMPAYCAEKYVEEAIKSVINQTFTDWELVVVDDFSSDNTVKIIKQYSQIYENIRLVQRSENSGGCRLPRFDGILAASGKFVCSVDADDVLEKDYLQKILFRQSETDAEIVLTRMIFHDEKMTLFPNRMIPAIHYDMAQVMSGIEACKMTIGGWDIAMAGMLVISNTYKNYIKTVYNEPFNGGFSDELDHRKILLLAKKVVMENAHYLYRQQPLSIVHDVSARSFNALIANQNLYEFVEDRFTDNFYITQRMQDEYVDKVYRYEIAYWKNRDKYTVIECDEIKNHLKKSYHLISEKKMKCNSMKHRLIMSSYTVMQLIAITANLYGKIRG